mgnify:CR=1 FL=1|jgi:hypothetical protein
MRPYVVVDVLIDSLGTGHSPGHSRLTCQAANRLSQMGDNSSAGGKSVARGYALAQIKPQQQCGLTMQVHWHLSPLCEFV